MSKMFVSHFSILAWRKGHVMTLKILVNSPWLDFNRKLIINLIWNELKFSKSSREIASFTCFSHYNLVFSRIRYTIKSNWPWSRLWMMNNLTNMHIKSSPAHIRLERKMTSIIWQKDFSVIVSFSCGQISSFDSRFDGTWILNEKQFRIKIYVFSLKFIISVKNVEKSGSVSSRVCFIMLNSDGWISSEGSNELSLSLIFEAYIQIILVK